jgi:hypothetical protein
VVAQVSVGMVLLVVAGLFTRTMVELQREDTGVRGGEAVLTTMLSLPNARTLDSAAHARFFDEALRLTWVPGVTSAGVSSHLRPVAGRQVVLDRGRAGDECRRRKRCWPHGSAGSREAVSYHRPRALVYRG